MKKKIKIISLCLFSIVLLSGCNTNIKKSSLNEEENTLYEYVNEISADAQFESVIGLVTEQPIFNNDNQKIGKRLFVESNREKITKELLLEFYHEISPYIFNYEEIVISLNDKEAVQVLLNNKEIWLCDIDENMKLVKKEKIAY